VDAKTQDQYDSGNWLSSQVEVDQFNGLNAGSPSSSAFSGALDLGYNWQVHNVVFGLEAGFGALALKDDSIMTGTYNDAAPWAFRVEESVSTDWLFTVRPRIGYSFGAWLLQANAGLGVVNRRMQASFQDWSNGAYGDPPDYGMRLAADASNVATALVYGLGAEYKLGEHYGVRVDYLYGDFGRSELPVTNAKTSDGVAWSDPYWFRYNLVVQVLHLGCDYHF